MGALFSFIAKLIMQPMSRLVLEVFLERFCTMGGFCCGHFLFVNIFGFAANTSRVVSSTRYF